MPLRVNTDGAMSAVKSDGAMKALTVDLEKPNDRAMAGLNTIEGLSDLFHGHGDAINNILRQTVDQLREEMVKARRGEHASVKMLRSFLYLDNKQRTQEGEFIALDLGGSTIRVTLFRVGSAGEIIVVKQNDSKLPEEFKKDEPEAILFNKRKDILFNMISGEVKKIITETGIDPAKVYPLIFTFAHPVNQISLSEATLVSWTKELKIPGVKGEDIVKILQESLNGNGVNNVKVVAILNDIVGTHAAAPDASAALILGTGYNVSVLDEHTREIINVHPSEFANIPEGLRTQYDEEFLQTNKSKFSNLISGRKIAELIRLMSIDRIKDGNLRQGLLKEDPLKGPLFSISVSSKLGAANSIEEAKQVLTENLGLKDADITDEDVNIVREINKVITERAGYMVAVSLTASLQMIDPNIEKEHVIVVDGSVYQKNPALRKYIEDGFVKILGERRARQIKIEFIKDAFVIGAARTAALVSGKTAEEEALEAEFWAEEAADRSREDTLSIYRRKNPGRDSAQLAKHLGGIDLNQINVKRNGRTINVKFDPSQINELTRGGFKGFMPVIINIIPIQSPLTLLGVNPVKESEAALAKA